MATSPGPWRGTGELADAVHEVLVRHVDGDFAGVRNYPLPCLCSPMSRATGTKAAWPLPTALGRRSPADPGARKEGVGRTMHSENTPVLTII